MASGATARRGPEVPTLPERFVLLARLPYTWGCVFWAVIFAVVIPIIGGFLDTFDLSAAVSTYLNPGLQTWQGFAVAALNVVDYGFLPFFLVRYMRLRLVRLEPDLIAVSPHGEESLHRVFGGVSRYLPPILIGAAVVGISSIPGSSAPIPVTGLYQSLANFAYYFFAVIVGFGSFIWVYISALRGLYKLGGEDLRLRPSSDDPMLGLRPMGSISLSFAFAYFAVVGSGVLYYFFVPFDLASAILYPAFLSVGLIMFFLPLSNIHRKMQSSKRLEQASIRSQLSQLTTTPSIPRDEGHQDSLPRIERLLALQIMDHKVSSIPTWPFDTGMLGRFAAIILSVVAILISRFLGAALRL